MHEHVLARLRGDEAKALLGVEPFHGSNRHLLVPPSTVLEVSPTPALRRRRWQGNKLDLRVARQNVNLCRAHNNGLQPPPATIGRPSMPPSTTMAVHASS